MHGFGLSIAYTIDIIHCASQHLSCNLYNMRSCKGGYLVMAQSCVQALNLIYKALNRLPRRPFSTGL